MKMTCRTGMSGTSNSNDEEDERGHKVRTVVALQVSSSTALFNGGE